jgi:hypothetical protein
LENQTAKSKFRSWADRNFQFLSLGGSPLQNVSGIKGSSKEGAGMERVAPPEKGEGLLQTIASSDEVLPQQLESGRIFAAGTA